jgi:lipoate-protein ligase B
MIRPMMTKTDIQVLDLGQVAYERALEVQKALVDDIAAGRASSTIIICEHPPVITYGRRAKKSNILATEDELKEAGVRVCFADRGGDVTFHGPGQLVFYPLIDLRQYGKDLHRYIRVLEQAVIRVLRDVFTLNAYSNEGATGVWVGPYKIASIGIGVRNWVTYHGLSLNVKTDARFFSMIRSCGMDAPMASLSSFFRDELIVVKKVKEAVKESLISHFSRREIHD